MFLLDNSVTSTSLFILIKKIVHSQNDRRLSLYDEYTIFCYKVHCMKTNK